MPAVYRITMDRGPNPVPPVYKATKAELRKWMRANGGVEVYTWEKVDAAAELNEMASLLDDLKTEIEEVTTKLEALQLVPGA